MGSVIEVHRQEANVTGNVDEAYAAAELHAVEDADTIREANSIRAQIAVAFSYPQLGNSSLERNRSARKEGLSIASKNTVLLGRQRRADLSRPLKEVLAPGEADCPIAVACDPMARIGLGVKRCQALRQGSDHFMVNGVVLQEAVHHPLLGKSPHLDGILHDATAALK
jgi:hypothetical protein